jgi:hypothetical protein
LKKLAHMNKRKKKKEGKKVDMADVLPIQE